MMRICLWVCLLVATSLAGQGMAGIKNLDPAILVSVGYGPFRTGSDLANRFGNGLAIDGGVDYIHANGRWQLGVMAHYGFGNTVKEDVLSLLRTDAGYVIGNQREPAQVNLRHRQLFIGPRIGYTLPLGENQRAGIKSTTALGYFFSRIRFQQDPVQFVPAIEKSRQAGFDRLAGGAAIYQFLGYQQLALDRRLNFFVGAEIMAGFTRQLRSFDVPMGGPPPGDSRSDIVIGVRAGLILPIYLGRGEEIFY